MGFFTLSVSGSFQNIKEALLQESLLNISLKNILVVIAANVWRNPAKEYEGNSWHLLPAKSMVTQNLTQKQNTKDPSHHPSRDIYSDYFPKNPGEK